MSDTSWLENQDVGLGNRFELSLLGIQPGWACGFFVCGRHVTAKERRIEGENKNTPSN